MSTRVQDSSPPPPGDDELVAPKRRKARASSPAPDVFAYLDYRKFLREYYRRRKRESRAFSFRYFARKAGLTSPNHLKRVMDAERNLTDETALRYADAIGLDGDARAYFCELVRFDQAKTSREKSAAYRRLTQFRGYRRAQMLDARHDRYHSEWYIPTIREMLALPDFRPDPKWIARQLIPPITEKQASDALATLIDLGMFQAEEDGSVSRSDKVVSTGAEAAGVHIAHYHETMMERALESIDHVPMAERDLSGVTLCLPKDAIPELKRRIREFRAEVIAQEAPDGLGERVVHVAIQMFPLTRGRDE